MLERGAIQLSRSPWNSPLFLVQKKDGQYIPVIDFRKVNEVTNVSSSLAEIFVSVLRTE